MIWLRILNALLSLLGMLARLARDRRLTRAGRDEALAETLAAHRQRRDAARAARRQSRARTAAGGLADDDGFRRD